IPVIPKLVSSFPAWLFAWKLQKNTKIKHILRLMNTVIIILFMEFNNPLNEFNNRPVAKSDSYENHHIFTMKITSISNIIWFIFLLVIYGVIIINLSQL